MYTVGEAGAVTVWENAPVSDQEPKTYCVPVSPGCVVTTAMVCGPEVMMRFSILGLQSAGLPFERTYLSLERAMKCGLGLCGRCQFGAEFVCKEGAVMRYDRIAHIFTVREI